MLKAHYKQNNPGRPFCSVMSYGNIVFCVNLRKKKKHFQWETAGPQVFSPVLENTITASQMGFLGHKHRLADEQLTADSRDQDNSVLILACAFLIFF